MNPQGEGKIEYLTDDCNIVQGCSRNCPYCYVWRIKHRWNPKATREEIMKYRFSERELTAPLSRRKPSRIGLCFTGDLFNDDVPRAWIERVLGMCHECLEKRPDHRFLLLTKNPKGYGEFDIPENCWCGTSITGPECERTVVIERLFPDTGFASLEPFIGQQVTTGIFDMKWIIIGGLSGAKYTCPTKTIDWILERARKSNIPVFIKSNAGYPKKIQEYPEDLLLPWERTSK